MKVRGRAVDRPGTGSRWPGQYQAFDSTPAGEGVLGGREDRPPAVRARTTAGGAEWLSALLLRGATPPGPKKHFGDRRLCRRC